MLNNFQRDKNPFEMTQVEKIQRAHTQWILSWNLI